MCVYRLEYQKSANQKPMFLLKDLSWENNTGDVWPTMESAKEARIQVANMMHVSQKKIKIRAMPDVEAKKLTSEKETHEKKKIAQDYVSNPDAFATGNGSALKDLLTAVKTLGFISKNYDHLLAECDAVVKVEDLREQDYMHYIEFNALNAAQAAHLFKEIRASRLRRRDAKDLRNLLIMLQPASNTFKTCAETSAKIAENTRTYMPRVEGELFEKEENKAESTK